MRNNIDLMRDAARRELQTCPPDTVLALVFDPITNAEESGDYGYCPLPAVPLLFRFGTVVETLTPGDSARVH